MCWKENGFKWLIKWIISINNFFLKKTEVPINTMHEK